MGIRNKWGTNYPLIYNIVVLMLIFVLITSVTKSDREIIQKYQEEGEDLPLLLYQSNYHGDTVVTDINPVYQNMKSTLTELDYINQQKTRFSLYHDDNMTINDQKFAYASIFYLGENLWDQVVVNSSDKVVITNLPDQMDTGDELNVSLEFENSNLTLSESNSSVITAVPQFVHRTRSGTVIFTDELSLSLLSSPILFMPIPSEFPVLDLQEHQSWSTFIQLYIDQAELEEISDISTIRNYLIDGKQKLDQTQSEYQFSSHIDSELYRELSGEKRDSYRDLGDNIFFFQPAILAIQICFLYFLNIQLKRLYDQFDLLFARGHSISNLRNNLIVWYSIIPLAVISSAILGIQFSGLVDQVQSQFLLQLLIPWVLLQLFTTIFLILYNIRQFKIQSIETQYRVSKFSLHWYQVLAGISLILLVVTIVQFFQYQNKNWTRINNVGDLPEFTLPLAWFLLFFSIFLFSFVFERVIPEKTSEKVELKFSVKQLFSSSGIYIMLIVVLILSMGFMGAGTMQAEIDSQYYNQEEIFDFEARFSAYSSGNPVYFNHEDMMKIEGLTSYLLTYQAHIGFEGENYDFSHIINVYNQSLYDNAECECTNEELFGDKIWVNQELYDFIFSRGNETLFQQFMGHGPNEETISRNLTRDDFAIIKYSDPIIGGRDGNIQIVASTETFTSLGFKLDWPTAPDLSLNFEDGDVIDTDTVLNRIQEHINLNGNSMRVWNNQVEPPWKPDFETMITILKIGSYVSAVLVSILFVTVVTLDRNKTVEISRILQRYGSRGVVRRHYILTFGISVLVAILSLIGALILSSLIFGNYYLIYSNDSIRVSTGYNLMNNVLVNIGPFMVFIGISLVGTIGGFFRINNKV